MDVDRAKPTSSATGVDQLHHLLAGSDSVELKLTVRDEDHRSAVKALDMDPLSAQVRQVFFLDTPNLTLNRQGVVLRARRTKKADDTVVKLRPVVPEQIRADLRGLDEFSVEVDAMPGGYVCSASMRSRLVSGKVRSAVRGDQRLTSLFNKRQRAFLAQSAATEVAIDELSVLGPILVLKLRFRPPGFGRRFVAELRLYPDGSRILELSTKAETSDAFAVAAE